MSPKPTYRLHHRIYLALSGIVVAIIRERHMRLHILIGLLIIGPGIYLGISTIELIILILLTTIIISAELMNTAIELTIDLITKQYRIRAKLAKDIASGAVLVLAISTIFIGIMIYGPYID